MSAGDATYTFTADGFLASKHSAEGTTTYAYSALGELERVALADSREVTYTYDGSGRRVAKSVDGQLTERYEWADATRLLATYDASGALVSRFTYADARTPLSVTTAGATYHLAYDQVGSLRAVFAEDGSLAREIAYDSFGNVLSDSDPTLRIPLGFASGLADPDTGLTLFGARDYDPALGRWCAKDPIDVAGGDANLYGYCLADPVSLVDPAGLMSQDCLDYWQGQAEMYRRQAEMYGFMRNAVIVAGAAAAVLSVYAAGPAIGAAAAAYGAGAGGAGAAATIHGTQRLAESGFDADDVERIRNTAQQLQQADGGTVHLWESSPGRWGFMVDGRNPVVTVHEDWPWDKIAGLGQRYGWRSPWP